VAITQEMVDRELKISRLNVAEPLPPLTGADLDRASAEALNQLITRQTILQAASRQGFALDADFIESRADLLFGTYGAEALAEALVQAGATRADLLWWIGEIFTMEEFSAQVIMAGAAPEDRQQVYNEWLNAQRAQAQVITYLAGEAQTSQVLLVGETAPNFTLTALDGQPTSLSDYSGKVVLVNFWATWCPSCIAEMPDYEQIFQQKKPEFMVLGVNLQESGEHVQQYSTGLGLTFPVLLDSDGNVTTRQYQVTGMPGSFIVDRDGQVFYRHVGPMSAETLATKLAELGL
jgi:peroxiredoxin